MSPKLGRIHFMTEDVGRGRKYGRKGATRVIDVETWDLNLV